MPSFSQISPPAKQGLSLPPSPQNADEHLDLQLPPSQPARHHEPRQPGADGRVPDPRGSLAATAATLSTPGFRLYLLSLLLCQHHYLVANAQEKGIPLAQVDGTFTVQSSASWIIETIAGDFQLQLKPGAALERKEMDFLESRMKACPVSRNLPESVLKMITVNLAP